MAPSIPDTRDEEVVQQQLDEQLDAALNEIGYDEDNGDWWRTTYDGGDALGIKGCVADRGFLLDVSVGGHAVQWMDV